MPKTLDEIVRGQDTLKFEMRRILSDANAFVSGEELTKLFSGVTVEQLIDEALHRLEGTSNRTELRQSAIERVAQIKNEVATAVTTVKSRPPEDWTFDSEADKADLQVTAETTAQEEKN